MNISIKMIAKVFWVVLFSLSLGACIPSKVTDPADPRFDPMAFDFNDYKTHEEMAYVLGQMFEPGMDREYVDKILVNVGGARVIDFTERDNFGYSLNHDAHFQKLRETSDSLILYLRGGKTKKFGGWFVYVFYDVNDKAIELYEDEICVFREGAAQ